MALKISCKKDSRNILTVEAGVDSVTFAFGRNGKDGGAEIAAKSTLPVGELLSFRDFLCDHLFKEELKFSTASLPMRCLNDSWGDRESQWGSMLFLESEPGRDHRIVLSDKAIGQLIALFNEVDPQCLLSAQRWYEYNRCGRQIDKLQ